MDQDDIKKINEHAQANGISGRAAAIALGHSPSTFYTASKRQRDRKKPGPKAKVVTVIDTALKKERSLPELLAGIESNVAQIRRIFGL